MFSERAQAQACLVKSWRFREEQSPLWSQSPSNRDFERLQLLCVRSHSHGSKELPVEFLPGYKYIKKP